MMNDKYSLVLCKRETIVYYGYFHNDLPVELYCQPEEPDSRIGSIYAARVDRILPDLQAAFLEIGPGEKCYLPLPKDGSQPFLLSPPHPDQSRGLRAGDLILVQITRDASKSKLPAADIHISYSGQYLVLSMTDRRVSISRKITDADERDRLFSIIKKDEERPFGLIIRTNAAGVPEEELLAELAVLDKWYQEIQRRASISLGKALIAGEEPHYICCARDLPKNELDQIVTDSREVYDRLYAYYHDLLQDGECTQKLRLYEEAYPLWKLYRMETHFERALNRQVWLPSGASLTIDCTEAMVVIDVNTGSVIKKKQQEADLFYQINREAAKEIGRQIRLRNLSGIIIIDFINMQDGKQRKKILNLLDEACKRDRVKTRVIDITALHLLEMTRQKVRRPLHEQWRKYVES